MRNLGEGSVLGIDGGAEVMGCGRAVGGRRPCAEMDGNNPSCAEMAAGWRNAWLRYIWGWRRPVKRGDVEIRCSGKCFWRHVKERLRGQTLGP